MWGPCVPLNGHAQVHTSPGQRQSGRCWRKRHLSSVRAHSCCFSASVGWLQRLTPTFCVCLCSQTGTMSRHQNQNTIQELLQNCSDCLMRAELIVQPVSRPHSPGTEPSPDWHWHLSLWRGPTAATTYIALSQRSRPHAIIVTYLCFSYL